MNNNLTFLKTGMILRLVKFHWMVNKHSPIQECVTKIPNGDYGRQERQRKVIEGIVQKS